MSLRSAWICLLLLAPPAMAQEDETRVITVDRISDRVLRLATEAGYPNQLALAGEKGVVVFGTHWSVDVAHEFRTVIERELGRRDVAYVVNSSARLIGTGGNAVYADALIVAHESCRRAMERTPEALAREIEQEVTVFRRKANRSRTRLAESEAGGAEARTQRNWMIFCDRIADDLEKGFVPVLPSITFRDRLTLDLGDLTVHLIDFSGGEHSNYMIIQVPEERLVMGPFSSMHLAPIARWGDEGLDVERWLSVLDEVLDGEHEAEFVIAGFSDRWPRERLANRRDYIRDLWEGVTQATREGWDLETARERLSLDARFSYVKTWPIWRERAAEWVELDHREHLAAYWRLQHPSAAEAVEQALNESSLSAALALFRGAHTDERHQLSVSEQEFNALGYRLMAAGRLEEAIAVFQMNTEAFPRSGNVFDSLGEAYMNAGENARAIENYQRSLALAPENRNAVEMLRRLGVEP